MLFNLIIRWGNFRDTTSYTPVYGKDVSLAGSTRVIWLMGNSIAISHSEFLGHDYCIMITLN